MAKNFPYFKFMASEWISGDIVFEDFELQGIFINVCAVYWHRDGKITIDELVKRFKTNRISELIGKFILVDKKKNVSIKFLDEQLTEANHISKVNSLNGKKGAEAKKMKATAKRPLSDRHNFAEANFSKEEKEKEVEVNTNTYSNQIINANPNIPYDGIRKAINKTLGTGHTPYSKNVQLLITNLWNDGITVENIKRVVTNVYYDEWHKKKNFTSCAPHVLFEREFFDRYNFEPKKEIIDKNKIRAPWD